MSGELVLTDAGRVAMLQGWVARGAASRLHFMSASSTTLAVVVLAVPCGEIVDGALVLAQADPEGDLIAATGTAATALWYTYDNVLLASGAVTDEAGEGPFKLAGSVGTLLLAGGRARLGVTALT